MLAIQTPEVYKEKLLQRSAIIEACSENKIRLARIP